MILVVLQVDKAFYQFDSFIIKFIFRLFQEKEEEDNLSMLDIKIL